MKLLCVIPSYWPAFQCGGPITSVHALNRALVKKGVDVTVYTSSVGLDGRVPVYREVNVDGIKVTYFRSAKFSSFMSSTSWRFSLQMTKALKNNMKVFDVVYIVEIWSYSTAVAAYYCRQYSKPYIISPRGTLYPYTISKKAWKKWPYYKLVAKRDLRGAAVIHYTTKDEAEKCHSFLGLKNQFIIIPHGLHLPEFDGLPTKGSLRDHYPALKDKKVILFLSRINWKKGLDILSKAYGKLARERKGVHLLIVGPDEGGYEEKVRGWLREEGVLERVTFTGMLKGKEKLEAFAGSDLFVLPSYSENFGMAVIEAMACRLPVIISNQVGIYREVQNAGAGLIVQPDNAALYSALIRLLDNNQEALDMGKRGREQVEEQFAIEKIADSMVGAFKGVIESRQ